MSKRKEKLLEAEGEILELICDRLDEIRVRELMVRALRKELVRLETQRMLS